MIERLADSLNFIRLYTIENEYLIFDCRLRYQLRLLIVIYRKIYLFHYYKICHILSFFNL